ncbi:MAG: UvrD-helicase domain-containing protein [Candidatus Paceibacterota bacterium]
MTIPQYLTSLNEPQRRAALTTEGPLLVLAGAGSGKTRVITHRIVHLIHQGIAPHNILAITFTNKAAKEMRERALALIAEYPPSERAAIDSSPLILTFHALGVRILREHHATLNLRRHFTIYDRSDSIRTIKKALELAGYSPKQFEPRKILGTISRAKGDALSRSEFLEAAASYPDRVAAEVWEHYERLMRAEHALDFDDLLLQTRYLLKTYPVIRTVLQDRWRYIHIDEYQDTNKVQYEIVRLLAGEKQNVCAVGDVDQNIYSWRGADIANVLQFEKHFRGAQSIFLEENYRSTQTIIAASNSVIAKNRNRIEKQVFTKNTEGEPITLYTAMTGTEEAEYVALRAKRLIEEGNRPSSIAVLFRTNFQSRVLEEAFLAYNVPYQVLGTRFFERKEVKDVLSFLRLSLNPDSIADLGRVVNVPPRGIGKVTVLKLIEGNRAAITGATEKKVAEFDTLMMDIAKAAQTKKLSETLAYIMARTGMEKYFKESGTEDDLARLENLRELVSLAIRYDELSPEEAVEGLLADAALQSDQDEIKSKEEQDAVRLMTVHAAKGLEFPYVFVTGLEEGLFPHERLDDSSIDHEEERRLFYVALTRAERKVFLTHAHMRTIFGSQRVNVPSSFLSDIDEVHFEFEGVTRNRHDDEPGLIIEID